MNIYMFLENSSQLITRNQTSKSSVSFDRLLWKESDFFRNDSGQITFWENPLLTVINHRIAP